tara:strand:+ start:147 stop:488 length:342 start_codon:yes stop_codon:yes gene_type:complete
MKLSDYSCKATDPDAAAVSSDELAQLSAQIPNWSIQNRDGLSKLQRVYKCADFLSALSYAEKIGAIAENNDHHPALIIEWGKLTVSWWSHSINGLHHNDFVMAAKTDEIFKAL